jgi:hypothetical protein
LFRISNWNIGIVRAPISSFLQSSTKPQIKWFSKPRNDTYLADPFLATVGDKSYVLCEEFDYRKHKGRIVCIEITENDSFSSPQLALELPYHCSYPYAINYDGHVYCALETRQIGQISLYEIEKLPDRWKKVATLVDGFAGVDPTITRHNDYWWLFSSTGGEYSASRLFIWYSLSLLGPWKPHAGNPVKTDMRSIRPGGTPFVFDGDLYRPAQDCGQSYGGGIYLNQVVELSPRKFKEEEVAKIAPDNTGPYPDGLHTITVTHNMILVDGNRHAFSTAALRYGLIRKWGISRRYDGNSRLTAVKKT